MHKNVSVSAREAAKLASSKYYFTGNRCKRGHVSKRYTANGECWVCRQIYRRENKEKLNLEQNKRRALEKIHAIRDQNIAALIKRNISAVKLFNKDNGVKHCTFVIFHNRLPHTDGPIIGDHGDLLVKCYKCGKHFHPTGHVVSWRILSYEGRKEGEGNFYCSDLCRKTCSTYNTKPSFVDYKTRRRRRLARSCQKVSKKLLLFEQRRAYCYSFCEKCGNPDENLHLHHSILVSKDPIASIKQDGHMLLCEKCHMALHMGC